MKHILIIILCLLNHLCFSSVEEDLKKKVNKLLTELNSDSLKLDTTVFTSKYYSLMKKYGYKKITKWELSYEDLSDTIKMVTARYDRRSGYFGEVYSEISFVIATKENLCKIFNSYKFLEIEELNFDIEGKKFNDFWDFSKVEIIKDIRENLKLEVVESPTTCCFNHGLKGKLKLINNSKYDISWVKILIEHSDKNGISSATTKSIQSDIIRSKGYKIFEWQTYDCFNCNSIKYNIIFDK